MLQTFAAPARPEQGPPRLDALRARIAEAGLTGFLVPRADRYQGEMVAAADERLAWLTGFTGSAGFAAILPDTVGLFVDGRYRLQAREQVDLDRIEPVDWPETKLGPWLRRTAPDGATIGFDPWLHTIGEVDKLRKALAGSTVTLVEAENLVDAVWTDRPPPPNAPAEAYPEALAGRDHDDKRRELAALLGEAGQSAAVLTLPDSIAWLLNIRGDDVARVPVMHGMAVLHDDARVAVFARPEKLQGLAGHLGDDVTVRPEADFADALAALTGRVRVDRKTAPLAIALALARGAAEPDWGEDPCILPKARKTAVELSGAEDAHLRDGAAVTTFLAWLEARISGALRDGAAPPTEIEAVCVLENCRRATDRLRDIAFETIAGSGPHGAIVHYRVTEGSDRTLAPGELFLVDSGGQYLDGTTDVTRTVAVGDPPLAAREAFTRVLQGLIAMSQLRWPAGLAGRDIDAVARVPLWLAGQDYDHGTGHGVGHYLSVHEGPQRLSRLSDVPLKTGMILSIEPGYYREGAFGIRLENLAHVVGAPALDGGDDREMLAFATLTHVPIDRRLILTDALTAVERAWLDAYHAEVRRRIGPQVAEDVRAWLHGATAPLASTPG